MAEQYRVLRTFIGAKGKRYMPDEVVDGTTWRNASTLMRGGRIIPTTTEPRNAAAGKGREHDVPSHAR